MSRVRDVAGLEFELQRRLDDAMNTLRRNDEPAVMSNYWYGLVEGLAAALGALQCTNAAHEIEKAQDRIARTEYAEAIPEDAR